MLCWSDRKDGSSSSVDQRRTLTRQICSFEQSLVERNSGVFEIDGQWRREKEERENQEEGVVEREEEEEDADAVHAVKS